MAVTNSAISFVLIFNVWQNPARHIPHLYICPCYQNWNNNSIYVFVRQSDCFGLQIKYVAWWNCLHKLTTKYFLYDFRSQLISPSGTWAWIINHYNMPQLLTEQNSSDNDIKVKTAYNGNIMITYVKENVTYDELCREIRGICRFSPDQVIIAANSWMQLNWWIFFVVGFHFEMGRRRKWPLYNVIPNRTNRGYTIVWSQSRYWTGDSW